MQLSHSLFYNSFIPVVLSVKERIETVAERCICTFLFSVYYPGTFMPCISSQNFLLAALLEYVR